MKGMAYEWLRPQDATLWSAQTDAAPLEVGALCLFEAAALRDRHGRLRLADLRRHAESALGDVPRLRQVIVTPPFGSGRPAWVDDPRFDIANHVRAAALPRPGGRDELRQFVRRVLETPLDPSRPLWELWVVEGVEGDRVAIVPKVSHVAADGIAVLTFALSLLDVEPHRHPKEAVDPWTPSPGPGATSLLAGALGDTARRQAASLAGVAVALARPDRLAVRAVRLARAVRSLSVVASRLSITRPVGSHRDFAWVSLPMGDLRAAAGARGVKLNDVVLALVADAVGATIERAGRSREGLRPRVIVPVSTHAGGGDHAANAFSLMVADLPVGDMAPLARVDLVHGEMERCKASGQTDVGAALFATGALPPALLRRLAPLVLRHQPLVNLAVSNLAGSPVPLYLLGARLLEAYPFISLTANVAVIVGVLSHDRTMGVGITADPDIVRDVEALAGDIGRAAARLAAAVDGDRQSSRTPSRMASSSSP